MKFKVILTVAMATISINLPAQILRDADTVSDYLMITTEQQEIYLGRFLKANANIVTQCIGQWNLDKANNYFVRWVENHPQYLRRNLTSAFTASLLDACKLAEDRQQSNTQ